MIQRKQWLMAVGGALLAGSVLLGTACEDGVSAADVAVKDQEVTAERSRASALEQELADVKAKAAEQQKEAQKTTLVLGLLRQQPTPTPRPAATPAPAGATPAAPRTPPASYLEPIGDFAFYVENLTSSAVTEFGNKFTESCAQLSLFPRGSKIVWRIEVVDLKTGRRVMPADGAISVKLPNGEEKAGRFSQRGGGRVEGAPWMWSAAWQIPADYAIGNLDYEVVVKHKDGRVGTWRMPYSGTPVKVVE